MKKNLIVMAAVCLALTSLASADWTAYNDFQPNYVTPATNTTTWGGDGCRFREP